MLRPIRSRFLLFPAFETRARLANCPISSEDLPERTESSTNIDVVISSTASTDAVPTPTGISSSRPMPPIDCGPCPSDTDISKAPLEMVVAMTSLTSGAIAGHLAIRAEAMTYPQERKSGQMMLSDAFPSLFFFAPFSLSLPQHAPRTYGRMTRRVGSFALPAEVTAVV